MATIASGTNSIITINAGEVYRVISTGSAQIDVLFGFNWQSVKETVMLSDANNTYDFGPYSDTTKINIRSLSGAIEYNTITPPVFEVSGLVGENGQSYSLTANYTFSEFQSAISNGYVGAAFISDVGNGSMWVSDGVRGKPMNGEVVIYNSQVPVNLVTTTPRAVGIAIQLPIGLFKDHDVLEVSIDESKSGTVDASTTQLQIGTSQVTVGTQIGNVSMPMTSGGNRRAFGTYRIKRNSATSVTVLNGPNGQDGVAASSDLASTTSTVSTLDSGTNYLQLTNAMSSGGSDVVSVNKFIVKLITG